MIPPPDEPALHWEPLVVARWRPLQWLVNLLTYSAWLVRAYPPGHSYERRDRYENAVVIQETADGGKEAKGLAQTPSRRQLRAVLREAPEIHWERHNTPNPRLRRKQP